MARNTRAKKQPEAPKVDIGAEIFASLRELEKLKGIPVDYMVERLKQALTNAYRYAPPREISIYDCTQIVFSGIFWLFETR